MFTALRSSLTLQMVVATLLGVVAGLVLGDLTQIFAPWGSAYIMALRITTIPYLICAVMHGIGRLVPSTARQIIQKGVLFIACTWAINICMVYIAVYLFPSSQGLSHAAYSTRAAASINFAELLIPSNIFAALSNNLIPAVVVFGLLIGLALMHLREKQTVMSLLDTLVELLTRITSWVSRIAPIGTFLIIADRVGTVQLITIKQISTYLILYIVCISLLVFWIFPRIIGMFTSISPGQWIKKLAPIMLLAFTTNVVIVTLPFMIELIKRESEKFYRKDTLMQDQIQGIVSIIFNLPLGSLFITVFVFFTTAFYNLPLTVPGQVQLFLTTFLSSLGAVGLGSWINSLNFLLDTLGLPLAAIDTYLTTLPFTAGFQSLVSVMEITSLSLLIALTCHGYLQWKWTEVAKKTAITLVPLAVFIFAFKSWVNLPPIYNPLKSISDLQIEIPAKTTLYSVQEPLPAPREGRVLERILSSKIVRVGYNPEIIPFSFKGNQGQMIGYDIAFAHLLANNLQCDLELIPMNLSKLGEELNSGLYDVAMSGISITEDRLKEMCFTTPYIESRIVFIVEKQISHNYHSVQDVVKDERIKVVVRRGSSYECYAKMLLPANQIVTIENYDEFTENYPNDILLRGEPQGIAWTVNHPNYTVVVPDPGINLDIFGYPVALGADDFLCYLNQWLLLKKYEGLIQTEYDLWILGHTDKHEILPRRWSLIHNVLGWNDK